MIVWLASYPCSGAAYLRVVLHRCFGLKSYSAEADVLDFSPEGAREAGFVRPDQSMDAFITAAEASDDLYLIRTFGSPSRSERAIYMVRDGRAAIYGHWRLLSAAPEFNNVTPHRYRLGDHTPSLEEVVVGRTPDGSWSQHVEEWLAAGDDNLTLCYEDLTTEAVILEIAGFLGRDPVRDWRAQAAYRPRHIRHPTNDQGIAEVMRQCPDLFESAHGEMMRRLGYQVRPALALIS